MTKREGTYWFDEDAAERVIEFFPRYLLHVKGPWAGRRIDLDDWQKDDLIRPLFGWKRDHTCGGGRAHEMRIRAGIQQTSDFTCEYDTRRYRLVNEIIPRKNTKTTMWAGLLLVGLCADDEIGGENYCMAGDLDQATDLIFDIAAAMVEKSPILRKRLKVWRSSNRIVDPESDSFLQAIPGDFEGALGFSPHVAVMDEHLVQANTKLENAITSGMGARRQPIFTRASSAPKSVDTPTGRLILRIREIRAGVREARPDELNVLYEAPEGADWRKTRVWIIANPGYGKSLQPAFVESQIRKANDEPEERAEILQYGLNIIPDALGAWMPLEKWDACGALIDLEELAGHDVIIAIGLRSTKDIVAVLGAILPNAEGEPMRFVTDFYLPQPLLTQRGDVENAPPYHEWIERGAIHLVDDEVIDYDDLKKAIERRYQGLDIREWVGWRRHSEGFMQLLEREGEENVIDLSPTAKYISPALTELERLVAGGRKALEHDGSIVLRWMWTKARVKKGPNDDLVLDKQRSLGNIEGVIALASALNRAIVAPQHEQESWAGAVS